MITRNVLWKWLFQEFCFFHWNVDCHLLRSHSLLDSKVCPIHFQGYFRMIVKKRDVKTVNFKWHLIKSANSSIKCTKIWNLYFLHFCEKLITHNSPPSRCEGPSTTTGQGTQSLKACRPIQPNKQKLNIKIGTKRKRVQTSLG